MEERGKHIREQIMWLPSPRLFIQTLFTQSDDSGQEIKHSEPRQHSIFINKQQSNFKSGGKFWKFKPLCWSVWSLQPPVGLPLHFLHFYLSVPQWQFNCFYCFIILPSLTLFVFYCVFIVWLLFLRAALWSTVVFKCALWINVDWIQSFSTSIRWIVFGNGWASVCGIKLLKVCGLMGNGVH